MAKLTHLAYRIKPATKKGHLYNVQLSTNGRTLSTTELFTSKPTAWNNIQSSLKSAGSTAEVLVQDDALVVPVVYRVTAKKKVATDLKPKK